MELGACTAQQLCDMPGIPTPIKLPADKTDPLPSAPDEAKHICEHCHHVMHGGVCGHNLSDICSTLDMTKLHKQANVTSSIATICFWCYHDLLMTNMNISPAIMSATATR